MKKIISILLLLLLTMPSVVQYLKHSDVQVHLSMEMEELKDKDTKSEKSFKEYLSHTLLLSNFLAAASLPDATYSFFKAADPHLEFQSPPPDVAC